MKTEPILLDRDLLARHVAGSVVALDYDAIGKAYSFATTPALERISAVHPAILRATSSNDEKAKKVAILSIDGPLEQRATAYMCGPVVDGYDAIAARFDKAMSDKDVTAVVLRISSPGGDVAGLYEGVARMKRSRERAGKPVYAYADELAASAAYLLATIATAGIFLPATGVVGSVGCLMVHVDESRALEAEGLRVSIIRSGKAKAVPNSLEPLSDETRATLQAQVNALAMSFAEQVAEARKSTPQSILALEGATRMGAAAIGAGLADGIKSLEEVIEMAANEGATRERERRNQEAMAAILAAKPELEAARDGETVTAEIVAGRVLAVFTTAGQAEDLAAQVAKFELDEAARLETEKTKAENAEKNERVALVRGAVLDGKIAPASAFTHDDEGKQTGIAEPFASMAIATLRATVAAIPKLVGVVKAATTTMTVALTDSERAVCAQRGIPESDFAAEKAVLLRGKAATEK